MFFSSSSEKGVMWKTFRAFENLNVFFKNLTNSILSDDGKILAIPSTREGIPPYEIYVRECWGKIYELIYDGYTQRRKDDFVVTGSPGIGKSMFSYYFMWRCMQDDNFTGFYWEPERKFVIHYSPLSGSSVISLPAHRGRYKIPHFVDFPEKNTPSVLGSTYRVVFSSPNPARFKELLKGDGAKGFIQPPWSLKEILEAHNKIQSYREKYDIKTVRSQYDIYGGVPRNVFAHSCDGADPMIEALDEKATYVIDASIGCKMRMIDSEASYMIMHLYPRNTEDFSSTRSVLKPASQWVIDELERRDILKMDAKNANYIRWRQVPFETST